MPRAVLLPGGFVKKSCSAVFYAEGLFSREPRAACRGLVDIYRVEGGTVRICAGKLWEVREDFLEDVLGNPLRAGGRRRL